MDVSAEPVTIAEVDFASDGNLHLFRHSGLSIPEIHGTWTIDQASSVDIPIGQPIGAVWLKLVMLPCLPVGLAPAQRISIMVAELNIGSYATRVAEWTTLRITVPRHLLPADGILRLSLLHPTTVTLSDNGLSADDRKLAFLLQKLTVTAEGQAQLPPLISKASDANMPPVLRGTAELSFTDCIVPGRFGTAGHNERLTLFPSMLPPPQLPMRTLAEMPQLLIEEHFQYLPPPDVALYAIQDGAIWGNGVVTSGNSFVLRPDCFPSYFQGQVTPDGHSLPLDILKPENWATMAYERCDRPVACFQHPNVVYGHFLLEMLPKLYLLGELQALGCDFILAMSIHMPQWVKEFVDIYFDSSRILFYNPEKTVITAPSIIMPSMMQTSHNFHPCFNMLVADIHRRIGESAQPQAAGARRIFLSRSRIPYHRRLINEAAIEKEAEALGLEIIHPQEMSIREQIALFGQSQLIVGEYSSALHNTLFAPFGAQVVSIDMYSWYQSAIGRLRQQPHAFVAPSDGKFRHWRTPESENRIYEIDPTVLRSTIEACIRK